MAYFKFWNLFHLFRPLANLIFQFWSLNRLLVAHTVNMPTAYTDPFYCPVIWSVMLALDGFWDNGSSKGCHQKKLLRRRHWSIQGGRGKKIPFFSSPKRGHILMEGGVNIFLSHVPCSLWCFFFHTICGIFWGIT